MTEAVLVAGVLVQVVAWRLVVRDRLPFWPASATTFAVIGVASVLAADPGCCRGWGVGTAIGIGSVSGLVLFGATRLVVELAARQHPSVRGAVADVYRRAEETTKVAALALTLVIAVPGEELFWRGLVLSEVGEATTTIVGAFLAWAAAVVVNAVWASAPLLAGAVVGGALWTALAVWSGGVVAPIASHLVWTGLMLLWPPPAARGKVPS
jgi:uncharacterized protein